jgi:EAL domain-containing protein (putative c-di-GMP-specific phosphodiesterase class I)
VVVTASIGVAIDADGGESEDELMRHADLAMYAAKAQGKRSYVAYTSELHSSILKRMRTETELRWALERDEFVLFYQPIVHLDSGRVTGVEALIRWNHPDRGLVFPNDFIAVAESSELIVPIGEWVLNQACYELQTWEHIGCESLRLSVNVSPRQLSDPHFTTMVRYSLENADLDAKRLTLEVTESLFVDDSAGRTAVLEELRDIGVKIAIDDFGTGYSSLGSLRDMPVDILKIDKSFVDHITNRSESTRLVQMILQLADDFHLSVVAEGAEDLDQIQILHEMGCLLVQGYYFSKPLSARNLETLLQHDFPVPPGSKTTEASISTHV